MVCIKYMTLEGLLVWILIRWNKELKRYAWLHFVCVCAHFHIGVCVCARVPTCVRESGWNVLLADQLSYQLSSGGNPGLCTGYIQQETIFNTLNISPQLNPKHKGKWDSWKLSYVPFLHAGFTTWFRMNNYYFGKTLFRRPMSKNNRKSTTNKTEHTHTHTHTPGQHHIQRVKVGYPGQTAMRAGLA